MGFLEDMQAKAEEVANQAKAAAVASKAEARLGANKMSWNNALLMFLELGKRWDAQAAARAVSRWRCKSEQWRFALLVAARLYHTKSENMKVTAMRTWWDYKIETQRREVTYKIDRQRREVTALSSIGSLLHHRQQAQTAVCALWSMFRKQKVACSSLAPFCSSLAVKLLQRHHRPPRPTTGAPLSP
jgi:hypothetical protein